MVIHTLPLDQQPVSGWLLDAALKGHAMAAFGGLEQRCCARDRVFKRGGFFQADGDGCDFRDHRQRLTQAGERCKARVPSFPSAEVAAMADGVRA